MEWIDRDRIVGVILAGGLSRRMGRGDKGLLAIGRTTMLREIADRMRPQVRSLVLNANGDPERFASLGLPVAADTIDGFPGPLAGILAGMRWAAVHTAGATHVLSVSSDVPFLPRDLGSRLAAAVSGGTDRIAIAGTAGEAHPVIALWPVALADDLQQALASGARKVLAWAERHGAAIVDFPMSEVDGRAVDPFFNANTPDELDEVRRLLELAHR